MQKKDQSGRRNFIKINLLLGSGLLLGNSMSAKGSETKSLKTKADKIIFPADFVFGVSTSAYQIEGAFNVDGKGESIWDRWTNYEDGVAINGNNACNHYYQWKEDVELLKQLGVKAYRFSIAWTRIFPQGVGSPNYKGVEFYRNLISELVKNKITPIVTLYHWDLPQALQDNGGWASKETVDAYVQYATFMFKEFGDLVQIWTTFNEPWVTAFPGYAYGDMAPGISDMTTAIIVTHHLLLSHGRAVSELRKINPKSQIGITLDFPQYKAASPGEENLQTEKILSQSHFDWFAKPIFHGQYPEEILELYLKEYKSLRNFPDTEMKEISQSIDYLAINYYNTDYIEYQANNWKPYNAKVLDKKGKMYLVQTFSPQGLLDNLKYIHKTYKPAGIFITENGYNNDHDRVNLNGKVMDQSRIDYVYLHLAACKEALELGIPLKAYCYWAFIDNYEFSRKGYSRMGLVHVDFETYKRTIKESGYWFAKGIKSGFQIE